MDKPIPWGEKLTSQGGRGGGVKWLPLNMRGSRGLEPFLSHYFYGAQSKHQTKLKSIYRIFISRNVELLKTLVIRICCAICFPVFQGLKSSLNLVFLNPGVFIYACSADLLSSLMYKSMRPVWRTTSFRCVLLYQPSWQPVTWWSVLSTSSLWKMPWHLLAAPRVGEVQLIRR